MAEKQKNPYAYEPQRLYADAKAAKDFSDFYRFGNFDQTTGTSIRDRSNLTNDDMLKRIVAKPDQALQEIKAAASSKGETVQASQSRQGAELLDSLYSIVKERIETGFIYVDGKEVKLDMSEADKKQVLDWFKQQYAQIGLQLPEQKAVQPPKLELISVQPQWQAGIHVELQQSVDEALHAVTKICTNGRCISELEKFLKDGYLNEEQVKHLTESLYALRARADFSTREGVDSFINEFLGWCNEVKLEITKNAQTRGFIPSNEIVEDLGSFESNMLARVLISQHAFDTVIPAIKSAESVGEIQQLLQNFVALAQDMSGEETIKGVLEKAKEYGIDFDIEKLLSLLSYGSIISNSKDLNLSPPQAVFYGMAYQSQLFRNLENDSKQREAIDKNSKETSAILLAGALSIISATGGSKEEQAQKKAEEEKKRIDQEIANLYSKNDPVYIAISGMSAQEFAGAYAHAIAEYAPKLVESQGIIEGQTTTKESPGTDAADRKGGFGVKVIKMETRLEEGQVQAMEANQSLPASEHSVSPIRFQLEKPDVEGAVPPGLPPQLADAMGAIGQLLSDPKIAEQPSIIYSEAPNGNIYAIIAVKTDVASNGVLLEINPVGQITGSSVLFELPNIESS